MARYQIEINFNFGALKIVRTLVASTLVFAGVVLTSCGSAEIESNTMAVNRGPNQNTANGAPPMPAPNVNAANGFNANNLVDARLKKLEEMRKMANRAGKTVPSMNSRPAPEDSTMTATLTDVAREIREWKKHPVLAKVERIHDGGDGKIKVYLRDGKVLDLPGKSISQLDQIPAASVLELAGVTQPAAPGPKQPLERRAKN